MTTDDKIKMNDEAIIQVNKKIAQIELLRILNDRGEITIEQRTKYGALIMAGKLEPVEGEKAA